MKTLRLTRGVCGTIAGNPHRVIVTVPKGSVLSLVGPVEGKPDEVEVLWAGKSVWLFGSDLDARTTNDLPAQDPGASIADGDKVQETKKPDPPKVRRFNAAGRELF